MFVGCAPALEAYERAASRPALELSQTGRSFADVVCRAGRAGSREYRSCRRAQKRL